MAKMRHLGLTRKEFHGSCVPHLYPDIHIYLRSHRRIKAKNPMKFFSPDCFQKKKSCQECLCCVSCPYHLTYIYCLNYLSCLHYPSCLSSVWDGCRVAPPKRMNFRKISKGNLYCRFWASKRGFFI